MDTQTSEHLENQENRELLDNNQENSTNYVSLDNIPSDVEDLDRDLAITDDKDIIKASISNSISGLRSGAQGGHDETVRHIGKTYWQNIAVVKQLDNHERLGFLSHESRSQPSKKRRAKQDKSDLECFASFTFKSFNKEVLNAYESRNPQPKPWKGKS